MSTTKNSSNIDRAIRKLIRTYKGKRAKHYRGRMKAHRRMDEVTELITAALEVAYTEIQVDLEKILEVVQHEH